MHSMYNQVSGVHCHVQASSLSGCAFVYFTAQYRVYRTGVQYLYFKARMSKSKWKISSDVAGAAKKGQAITMETKVKIIENGARRKDGRHC